MNIENARILRLPKVQFTQATEIINNLRRDREARKKQRGEETGSPEPVESEMQGLGSVETSKNHEKDSAGIIEIHRPPPRDHMQSKMKRILRIMCCCFKPHRIVPDATFTVDK